ncbi:protein of unknown function [Candidatus Filomicrobium marinum]|uniref:Uncharacterized protein n=1 Tax=Candidatus Filomicrobium marinum TaxID=1608628 RepID=A0A0D6JGH6_9HYPH|nr:protein of unknown function [Candidatus Filomicrobium marinum]CPR20276.1 protein of unknown function [Candidatus Filomicrobium marinum]
MKIADKFRALAVARGAHYARIAAGKQFRFASARNSRGRQPQLATRVIVPNVQGYRRR